MAESDQREWEKMSIFESPGHGRGLEDYERILGFDRTELEGKSVLDLGAGPEQRFSRELAAAGINSTVIPLSPDYSLKETRKIINKTVIWEGWDKKSLAAIGQELPFKNETFDIVVGLASVTLYDRPEHNIKAIPGWVLEVARVLKVGGKALLAPVDLGDNQLYDSIQKELESHGLQLIREEFKDLSSTEHPIKIRITILKPKTDTV